MPLALKDADALVLAGGQGRRMGRPKAFLPLGHTTLLNATMGRLQPVFRRVILVAREGEAFAGLGVSVVTDDRPERGPLVGLARGLAASDAAWCFVAGCDMPFLDSHVIGRMAQEAEGYEVVVASTGGRLQPLHAFYSKGCLSRATELVESGKTSILALLDRCRVRTIDATELREIDPELLSFRDVDTWEEYVAAQRRMERAVE